MIRTVLGRLRQSLSRSRADARINEEIATHIGMATDRNIANGMDPERARREALINFGGVTRHTEGARDALRHRPLENAIQDVRVTVRRLRQRPAMAAAIIATLALGLGATTTVFSVVYGLLLKPLPYRDSATLVSLQQHWNGQHDGTTTLSPAEYFDYSDQLRSFAAFGVYALDEGDLGGADSPEHVPVVHASAGALAALGVQPVLGRISAASDDADMHEHVVMLTHEVWQQRYGASRTVIGQVLLFDDGPYIIIGVLPAGFRFPLDMASMAPARLVFSAGFDRSAVTIRGSHFLAGVGRLRPGADIASANADAASVIRDFSRRFPADYPAATRFSVQVNSLKESVIGAARPALVLLLVASGCLLAIACINAASLLLAQAETRQREMAVRRALGAATGRLVRQLLGESLLLAGVAGMSGVALAVVAVTLLSRAHPFDLPRMSTLHLDPPSLAFALVTTMLAALAFGLAPALRLAGTDLQQRLRDGGRGASSGAHERRGRRALIVVEIMMACALLVCASLLTLSFQRLLAVDLGFAVDDILTAPITIGSGSYPTDAAVTQLVQQAVERIQTIPGIRTAGMVAGVPLATRRGDMGIELEGHPVPKGSPHPQINWQVITPGYVEAIGMHLLSGRSIDATDQADRRGAVVVNAAMAKKFWPGENPVGRRFKLPTGARPDTVTVVGVVADVRQSGLSETPGPEMYLAHAQFHFWGGGGMLRSLNLVMHTNGDARSIVPALRREMSALAPTLPIGSVRTISEIRSQSVAMPKFMMLLLLAVAAVALIIAVVGLYALVAHAVQLRRKEFGIRMALGAGHRHVVWLATREGAWLTAAGLAAGIPAALGAAALLQRFLFNVHPIEPLVLLGVAASLAAVAMAAAYLPARRAARAAPVAALRGE